ncbi:MAG: hypothetical protein J6M95_03330 [Bacilli bacterium]|nr:hypothetical protein [Bacilli bacterium]
MEEKKQKIEVIYKKAKLGKRMLAYFIDIGLFLLTTFILFSIVNVPVTNSGWFISKRNELTQLRNDSGLYINGLVVTEYVKNDTEFPSYEAKKDELSTRINNFYNNTTYFSDLKVIHSQYDSRRLSAKNGSLNLFIKSGDEIIENSVNAELLYNFYKGEVENYTLGFLVQNPTYFYLVRFSFWVSVIEFISILIITFTIYYLVLPLTCFKRGRQTIGMKLEKIGIIGVTALNVPTGKFIGRFLFNFLVFVVLDFIGFLIPAIISITMMYFNKTNSNLTNYVFNDYAVDVTDKEIYLNELEREEASFKLQEISIENKDLRLR